MTITKLQAEYRLTKILEELNELRSQGFIGRFHASPRIKELELQRLSIQAIVNNFNNEAIFP